MPPHGPTPSAAAMQPRVPSSKMTYRARRREGLPCHGKTSVTVIIVGLLSWFMNAGALFLPYWLSNYRPLLGYMYYRHWGLWQVQGKVRQWHHQIMSSNCGWWGGLMLGGMCKSPICLWYELKCRTYFTLMVVSYTIGAAFALVMLLHALCMVWTFQMRPRSLKFASRCWPLAAFLNLACLIAYFLVTEDAFSTLDEKSAYPAPSPGFCFNASFVAVVFLGGNAVMGCMLAGWWPEEHLVETSSSDDDAEHEKEEGDEAFLKAGEPQGKGGFSRQQPRGYDPSQGYAVQPPQGYSPAQGYGMQPLDYGMQPQGYDTSQGYSMQPPQEFYGIPGAPQPPPSGGFQQGYFPPPLPPGR